MEFLKASHLCSKADIIVTNNYGALCLSDSLSSKLSTATEVVNKDYTIVPHKLTQFVELVESPTLRQMTTSNRTSILGNLMEFNHFKNTDTLLFSRGIGARMTDMKYTQMSPRLPLYQYTLNPLTSQQLPNQRVIVEVRATRNGTVDAVMLTWDIAMDKKGRHVVSSDPVKSNFARDLAYGQGIQLIEDEHKRRLRLPTSMKVRAGERLTIEARFSKDRDDVRVRVHRGERANLNERTVVSRLSNTFAQKTTVSNETERRLEPMPHLPENPPPEKSNLDKYLELRDKHKAPPAPDPKIEEFVKANPSALDPPVHPYPTEAGDSLNPLKMGFDGAAMREELIRRGEGGFEATNLCDAETDSKTIYENENDPRSETTGADDDDSEDDSDDGDEKLGPTPAQQ